LTEIEGLDNLVNLEVLDLSYNQITTLKGLENLKKIKELWLNSNKIENFKDLDLLESNKTLDTIYLGGNPVASYPDYRQKLLQILPDLD